MSKKIIRTADAPEPIGPYSQAVAAGGFLFASGQIAIDPQTGEMSGGGVEEQARRVFKNLGAVLKAAGCGWNSVVKSTIYLKDLGDFGAVNKIYGELFESDPPARATVEAAGLPKGALVEVDVTAWLGE